MAEYDRADIYNPYSNASVTRDYVAVIESSLRELNILCGSVNKLVRNRKTKKRAVVVITALDAIKARLAGYGFVIFWAQGIAPEESYMRRHSRLRYMILSLIEYAALRTADFMFFVSNEMMTHYMEKYKIKFDDFYIMPCFNEEIEEQSFLGHDYSDNRFVYAGSLSEWQCFEKTVQLYKKIEERYAARVNLRVLTFDMNEARKMLLQNGIRNFSVASVPKEDVKEEMNKAKFGFCIREDMAVNRVATPTKLSSYVCNGVIPIYSSYICSFHKIASGCRYCLCEDDEALMDRLDGVIEEEINKKGVFDEFKRVFGNYYSSTKHGGGGTEALKRSMNRKY